MVFDPNIGDINKNKINMITLKVYYADGRYKQTHKGSDTIMLKTKMLLERLGYTVEIVEWISDD